MSNESGFPPRHLSAIRPKRHPLVLVALEDSTAADALRNELVANAFSAMCVSSANELLTVAKRLLPGFAIVDADSPSFGRLNLARQLKMAGSDVSLVGLVATPTAASERIARLAGFDCLMAHTSTHATLVAKLLGTVHGDARNAAAELELALGATLAQGDAPRSGVDIRSPSASRSSEEADNETTRSRSNDRRSSDGMR